MGFGIRNSSDLPGLYRELRMHKSLCVINRSLGGSFRMEKGTVKLVTEAAPSRT